MRNRVNFTLLAILALAFVLRLIHLDVHSLWYDEAFAVLFAEKGLSGMLYGTLTPVAGGASDIHPLLYYMTLNGWMALFGQSPFVVRLWSVILGVAGIGVLYLIARDLFGQRTGYAAALLAAVMPFHIHYSQEARMYTLLALLLLLATYFYLRASTQFSVLSSQSKSDKSDAEQSTVGAQRAATSDSQGPQTGGSETLPYDGTNRESASRNLEPGTRNYLDWLLFGTCAGLAMYTQQLAAFYLAALGLMPLFTRKRAHFTGMAIGVAVALVIYAPWLVNIPSQLQKVNSYYWVEKPAAGVLLTTLYLFMTTYAEIPAPWSLIALLAAMFVLALSFAQVVIYLRMPRRRKSGITGGQTSNAPLLFVLWLWLMPMLLMWLVSQIQPVFLERSLITSAIMLYLFLAWVFTRSGMPVVIRGVLALFVLATVGVGMGAQYTLGTFPYSPVKELTACVRGQWREGDVIIHMNKLTALPGKYYARDLNQHYIGDYPGAPEDTLAVPTQETLQFMADKDMPAAANGASRVWFVVLQRAELQYAAANRPELSDAFAWLGTNYAASGKLSFNDVNVYLYSNRPDDPAVSCAA